jgi:hypothetical protein
MAFDNQLGRGKDRRKPYYDSRQFDWTCRNHGGCGWCESNRTFANHRRIPADEAPKHYNREPWHFWRYDLHSPRSSNG